MAQKHITQRFPWLLPLRRRQRLFCFYTGMWLDGHRYAREKKTACLPHLIFEARSPLYNTKTGFDMAYQHNKVFNLKLAAVPLQGMLIRPEETFSFWKRVKNADRQTPYKEGLIVVNGKMTTAPGGGLCQMSNLLFWMFLHTPLEVIERYGHTAREFPDEEDGPVGVDATVSEGWLDLKAKNKTQATYQIHLSFTKTEMIGRLYSDVRPPVRYEITNGRTWYTRKQGEVTEHAEVLRKVIPHGSEEEARNEVLYINHCKIGYALPETVVIKEEGEGK